MILDGHIHIGRGDPNPTDLAEKMQVAGAAGGVIISMPPVCFLPSDDRVPSDARPDDMPVWGAPAAADERLDNLFAWTDGPAEFFPFFWIDPTEDDAVDQVARAVERGVAGFKVICSHHYPGDERAMGVYRAIAEADKPMLFHSGILWDGKPSSNYSRPAGFEDLLPVPRLRFALAHISWPWCDECLAVYGKFRAAKQRRPSLSCEMFIDTTRGTPLIYRRDALTKLFTVGYELEGNVFFGSDCMTGSYGVERTRDTIRFDRDVLAELGLSDAVQEQVFSGNLRRFLGV